MGAQSRSDVVAGLRPPFGLPVGQAISASLRFWKQWGRPRTRRRKLLRLGIGRDEVKKASRSRKGHWRMSHNSLVKRAMTNEWLAEQDVLSLEQQWVSIRYPDGPKKKSG